MISILFASLLALLAVEYFFRLPFVSRGRALIGIANKSARVVISKKISDHWKEIVLLRYARELATHTVVLALMLFGCVLLVVLPALFLDWLFVPKPSTIDSFSSLLGLSSMTIVSFLYITLRKRLGKI
jgi:hypothetical protein